MTTTASSPSRELLLVEEPLFSGNERAALAGCSTGVSLDRHAT